MTYASAHDVNYMADVAMTANTTREPGYWAPSMFRETALPRHGQKRPVEQIEITAKYAGYIDRKSGVERAARTKTSNSHSTTCRCRR
jgi:tRNA U34 5-carboxymethylaminomethyl modifying enzyme MnmG/GidA